MFTVTVRQMHVYCNRTTNACLLSQYDKCMYIVTGRQLHVYSNKTTNDCEYHRCYYIQTYIYYIMNTRAKQGVVYCEHIGTIYPHTVLCV